MKVSTATAGAAGALRPRGAPLPAPARAAPATARPGPAPGPQAPRPQAPNARPRRSRSAVSRPGLPAPVAAGACSHRARLRVGRAGRDRADSRATPHAASSLPPRARSPGIPKESRPLRLRRPPRLAHAHAHAHAPAQKVPHLRRRPAATPSVSRATRAPLSSCARHAGGGPRALCDGGRGPQRLPAHGQRAGGERPGERPGSRPGPSPRAPGAAQQPSGLLCGPKRLLVPQFGGGGPASGTLGARLPDIRNLTCGCGAPRAAPGGEATRVQAEAGLRLCALCGGA